MNAEFPFQLMARVPMGESQAVVAVIFDNRCPECGAYSLRVLVGGEEDSIICGNNCGVPIGNIGNQEVYSFLEHGDFSKTDPPGFAEDEGIETEFL